ncbi:hypothetical protein WJX77_004063 [Trebouxia sp. C0004]
MEVDPTMPVIQNMLLLDSEGKRIAVKYFDQQWATIAQQSNFEKSVFSKTSRTNARGEAEVTMFDEVVVCYKFIGDLMFYVTGSQDENELILHTVLVAFYESVTLLLRSAVEKKTVLENLDLVLLAMDEIIDKGLILETDPATIASRVSMRGADSDIPLTDRVTEVNIQSFLATAKEQLARSLLK